MQDLELEGLLRQLKLSDIRENCDDLVSEAIDTNEGYRDFLKRIFRYELEGRERRLSDKLIKAAGFDYCKTLDEIEYSFNLDLSQYLGHKKLNFFPLPKSKEKCFLSC